MDLDEKISSPLNSIKEGDETRNLNSKAELWDQVESALEAMFGFDCIENKCHAKVNSVSAVVEHSPIAHADTLPLKERTNDIDNNSKIYDPLNFAHPPIKNSPVPQKIQEASNHGTPPWKILKRESSKVHDKQCNSPIILDSTQKLYKDIRYKIPKLSKFQPNKATENPEYRTINTELPKIGISDSENADDFELPSLYQTHLSKADCSIRSGSAERENACKEMPISSEEPLKQCQIKSKETADSLHVVTNGSTSINCIEETNKLKSNGKKKPSRSTKLSSTQNTNIKDSQPLNGRPIKRVQQQKAKRLRKKEIAVPKSSNKTRIGTRQKRSPKPVIISNSSNITSTNHQSNELGTEGSSQYHNGRHFMDVDNPKNDSVSEANGSVSISKIPFIRLQGDHQNPTYVEIVNTDQGLIAPSDNISPTKALDPCFSNINEPKRLLQKIKNLTGYSKNNISKNCQINTSNNGDTTDNTWVCIFCHRGSNDDSLGDLFGPYWIKEQDKIDSEFKQFSLSAKFPSSVEEPEANDITRTEVWFHEDCICWNDDIRLIGNDIYGIEHAINAANDSICFQCHEFGSTICCIHPGCSKMAHFPCAIACKWNIDRNALTAYCFNHKMLHTPSSII